MLANWRFQQALYRAYYDAYVRSRLIYETDLEEQAMDRLRQAGAIGSIAAMDQAEAILDRAVTQPVAADLRARVFELGEALFQSIRMQLSVPRYKAISVGRGANLDTIDQVLNDRLWLKRRFAAIRKLDVGAGAAQGDRGDRRLDEPRARRVLRRSGQPAPTAPPGPRLALRRGPGLVPRPDDRLRPGPRLASRLVPARRHALRRAAAAALHRARPRRRRTRSRSSTPATCSR